MYTTVSHRIESYQDLVKYKKESIHCLQFSVLDRYYNTRTEAEKEGKEKQFCQPFAFPSSLPPSLPPSPRPPLSPPPKQHRKLIGRQTTSIFLPCAPPPYHTVLSHYRYRKREKKRAVVAGSCNAVDSANTVGSL